MRTELVTRRSFLAGVGGAALAGLASTTAISLTERGAVKAYADELLDESSQADFFGEHRPLPCEPIEPEGAPDTWDEEWDVIVVGAGGGLAGGVASQANGAKTLVLEKNDFYGGSSRESSTWLVTGTDFQLSLGMPDISEALYQDTIAKAPANTRYLDVDKAINEASKRLCNDMSANGFGFQPATVNGEPGPAGLAPAGTEQGGFAARVQWQSYDFLTDRLAKLGGELRLGVKVTNLIMDNSRVVGVRAHIIDGADLAIKANNGVLLATGGMGANRPMLKQYIPNCYYRSKFSTAGTWDTGEGILMGLGAGGHMDGYNSYSAFDGGINGVDWNTYMYVAAVQIARQPWLGIDVNGNRYPYLENGANAFTEAAEMLARLPRSEGYVFFDSTYEEYGDTFNQQICRRLIDRDLMPGADILPEYMVNPHWRDGVKEAISKGLIIESDNFDEIADKLDLDRSVVNNAVANWNEMCEQGTDPQGLIADQWLHPLSTPPYYGMALGEFVFATHCGLAVNEKAQVIDHDNEPVAGLYAAGCTIGKYGDGANASSMFAAGSAYLAGENLAKDHE